MKTFKLLFWSAVAYSVLLVLVAGLYPSEGRSTLPVTGLPLVVIIVIIVRNLARRSTISHVEGVNVQTSPMKGNQIQFFSSQIKVAAEASDSYFEDVIRSKLKELLVAKVAVQTGLEPDVVRLILTSPTTGLKLLKDETLYEALYGPVPETSPRRIEMIDNAIDLIGAWKG